MREFSIKRIAIGAFLGSTAAAYLSIPFASDSLEENTSDHITDNTSEISMPTPIDYPDNTVISRDYYFSVLKAAQEKHVGNPYIVLEKLEEEENKTGIFEDDQITIGELKETISSLDPHSSYYTPGEYNDFLLLSSGNYVGIGIMIQKNEENNFIEVIKPIENSPAEKTGIIQGDMITHINGQSTTELDLDEARTLMIGVPDTSVSLTIQKTDNITADITLNREMIDLPSVESKVIGDDIAYIKISSFSADTDNDVDDAIRDLRRELGRDLKGYVIDLRGNLGGYLNQAIEVSDNFLKKGIIVSEGDARGNYSDVHKARYGDLTRGKPIVVLTNGSSASASEIVAGALQDHDRATILGTRTYGKGSVQNVYSLADGSGLKVTTKLYYTPSGDSIQGYGITPDIRFEKRQSEDQNASEAFSEAANDGTISNPNVIRDDRRTSATCKEDSANTIKNAEQNLFIQTQDGEVLDAQLACAVDLLRDEHNYTVTTPVSAPALTQ